MVTSENILCFICVKLELQFIYGMILHGRITSGKSGDECDVPRFSTLPHHVYISYRLINYDKQEGWLEKRNQLHAHERIF